MIRDQNPSLTIGESLEPKVKKPVVDLAPEISLPPLSDKFTWPTLDLVMTINTIKLQLFDSQTFFASDYKEHGIARFVLSRNSLRLKVLSDGAMEIEVVLKSFTIGNTRVGASKFREIIPAAQHDRNQFMLLYTTAGETPSTAMMIMTIDSPKILFAMDPVFALLRFFASSEEAKAEEATQQTNPTPEPRNLNLDFRLDLHDASISVLESDSDLATQAIELTISQLLLSQQVCKADSSFHLVKLKRIRVLWQYLSISLACRW